MNNSSLINLYNISLPYEIIEYILILTHRHCHTCKQTFNPKFYTTFHNLDFCSPNCYYFI